MKVALVGCGMMGRGAADALATRLGCDALLLVDRDAARADALAGWLRPSAGSCTVSVAGLGTALRSADAVAIAAPWPATAEIARACAAAAVPCATIARPDPPEMQAVGEQAAARGVGLLGPLGLEPGLTELLARHVVEALDQVERVDVRCGGVPVDPRPPLGYVATFGGGVRLPIAPRTVLEVHDGRLRGVDRFTGVERVQVDGLGVLEAYHDGMVPWLVEDPVVGRARAITQKTLRWPGFARIVRTLADLGLLDDEPLAGAGLALSPREVVEHVLAPSVAWRDSDADAVVLRVTAVGAVAGRRTAGTVELRDAFDAVTGLSAMARTTGYTLAAGADLLARGALAGRGWMRPNEVLDARQRGRLLSWLTAQGVRLESTSAPHRPARPAEAAR